MGLSHKGRAEANQTASRNAESHTHPVAFAHIHGLHLALAVSHQLGDSALVFARNIDGHQFIWLVNLAVNNLGNHLWLTYRELKAFATHGLNQHGERHFTAALNFPSIRTLSRKHA